jgi:para-aminobenzoate synthetase/4-amino-4-deoxychorismate lyase
MLRALANCTELATSTLACLAGRWQDGSVLIGWDPARTLLDQPPPVTMGQRTEAANAVFGAGWLGWLDYSGGCWFGLFETVLCHDGQGWLLESVRLASHQLAELAASIEALADQPSDSVGIDELAGTSRDVHLAAVERAIIAIRAGQLYQVNVCARLTGRLRGSAIDLFAAGLTELAPDYAAFLRTPERIVVSMSPELFLGYRPETDGTGIVRSAPIKGTRRRTVAGDRADDPAALELLHSTKDRAENVMIVDLMRNDLSRVCRPGSVRAEQLLKIRPAPGVWHLVSQVTGHLRPQVDCAQLLAASFPPGSVTGAPKLRALALIDELEGAGRGLFTGAIGQLSTVTGRAEFSVAIRTFEISGTELQLGVGGGITADSVPMEEWQECLVKAAPLLALGGALPASYRPAADRPPGQVEPAAGVFETMLALDGLVPALADHLGRLAASCEQLYRRRLPAELADQVLAAVAGRRGRHRVRLTVRPGTGAPLIEVALARPLAGPVSAFRQDGRTGNWRHKWADRRWLVELESRGNGSLPLFTDQDGCLAETSRGNLVIVPEPGVLRTPVLSDQVLPGVTRRRLLDAAGDRGWRIELGPVSITGLLAARLAVSTSAISGVLGIASLDGHRLDLDRRLLGELAGWLD